MITTQSDKDFLKTIIPRFSDKTKITLLYRLGEKDDWNTKIYREKVLNKGPTLVLVKSGVGLIAGGFTSIPWSTAGKFVRDDEAILFSVSKRLKYPVVD